MSTVDLNFLKGKNRARNSIFPNGLCVTIRNTFIYFCQLCVVVQRQRFHEQLIGKIDLTVIFSYNLGEMARTFVKQVMRECCCELPVFFLLQQYHLTEFFFRKQVLPQIDTTYTQAIMISFFCGKTLQIIYQIYFFEVFFLNLLLIM